VVAGTNAVPDAPVASGKERFVVVLFSPGGGMGRTTNTAWAEELASHGYAVAALDHPYDTAASSPTAERFAGRSTPSAAISVRPSPPSAASTAPKRRASSAGHRPRRGRCVGALLRWLAGHQRSRMTS